MPKTNTYVMIDKFTREVLKVYHSCAECSADTGIGLSTVPPMCKRRTNSRFLDYQLIRYADDAEGIMGPLSNPAYIARSRWTGEVWFFGSMTHLAVTFGMNKSGGDWLYKNIYPPRQYGDHPVDLERREWVFFQVFDPLKPGDEVYEFYVKRRAEGRLLPDWA